MIHWQKPCLFGNEEKYLLDAIKSTMISRGSYVDKFEQEFSKLHMVDHTITTSNGTTALTLALLGINLQPRDEVIIPGFCFVAAANTIIQIGAKPIYVDIDSETWNINPDKIQEAITPQTKAILIVHNYGNPCDMDKITQITKQNNLYLIEDVAEAVFSKYNNKFLGTFGDIGCFSFQATKTITTGEGGAVITNNKEIAEKMKNLKNHAMSERKYLHNAIGYNFRLTNLQSALGCAQLEKLPYILHNKKRVYASYKEKLKDLKGITFQKITENSEPIMWAITIKIDPEKFKMNRNELIQELLKRQIETRPGFYPFSEMPFYNAPKLENSIEISKNLISLPSFSTLTENEIDYICEQLKLLQK